MKAKELQKWSYLCFKKMNKRGFLLAEETLKLILAVIAIGFLVYLLFSLYFSVKASRDLELAKESLNFLMSEINAGRERVDIYNPKNWMITIWPHDVTRAGIKTEKEFPKSCSNIGLQSCICICKFSQFKPTITTDLTAEECDNAGICLDNKGFSIEEDEDVGGGENTIEIKDPPVNLNIDQANKRISIIKEEAGSGFSGGGSGEGIGGAGGGGF